MFIEPTITWIPSGFSVYIWLDTKKVLKKNYIIIIIIYRDPRLSFSVDTEIILPYSTTIKFEFRTHLTTGILSNYHK